MKETNTGFTSRNSSPHKDGLKVVDVTPFQCPPNPPGSQSNTPATVRSGTEGMPLPHMSFDRAENELKWYIVLFDKPNQELKFKKTVQADKDHSKNILEVYCPTKVVKKYVAGRRSEKTAKLSKDKRSGISYKETPLFAGSDFVYTSYQALSTYLRDYFPIGSIQFKKKLTADQKTEPLTVPENQMYEFMNFNDKMIDYVVKLDKPFSAYAFNKKEGAPNDTLKIVDGVLAGLTGYLTKIDRNRGMVFKVANPYGGEPFTFAVPNIWDFHVVRLHNAEQDKLTMATAKARAVDLLIGLLQGSGFDDTNIEEAFYFLLDKLSHGISLQKSVDYLLAQQRAVLEFSTKQEELATPPKGSRNKGKKSRLTIPEQQRRLQLTKKVTKRVKEITVDDNQLLYSLVMYVKDNPHYVQSNWNLHSFRPFLTPTSGLAIPKGENYAILEHRDYKEIIKRVVIHEDVYYPSNGEDKIEDNIYFAHVGIKKQGDNYVIFTNWDKFLGAYFSTDGLERIKLMGHPTQNKNGVQKDTSAFYSYAKELYNVLTSQSLPVVATQGFALKKDININVLSITIPNLVLSSDDKVEDSPEIREAVARLVDEGIKICKQINSTSHLALWRGYLASVWLHK